ncbi:hypothetical protein Bca52824_077102 [Brassica carinata]|uniref:Uncharacterized protein n=1 Tax=Brassica carinata TaxID=52824 RepID=A0A8X7PWI7_BRACI|nr:hypothetical protein Bca52824_077102 [Brassica carinata]
MLNLSGPTIETRLQPPPFDAGEASSRRRRDLLFSSFRFPCLQFVSTVYASSPTWCSVSDNVSAHTNVPLRRKLFSSSRSSCLSLYRSGSTGSEMFWGVPQPVESLAGYTRRSSSTLVCYCAYLSLDEYPPLVGVDTMHPSGVAPRLQDPSSSPPPELFVSPKFLSPRRFKKRFGVLPPPRLISPFVGRRPEPMARPSPDLSYLLTRRRTSYTVLSLYRRGHVLNFLWLGLHTLSLGLFSPLAFIYQWSNPLMSQPTFLWGLLVSVNNCQKIIDGFSGLFTEAGSPYLSYTKSLMFAQSPMGSPGSPSSPLAYFCLEKRTFSSTTSLLRSVSLPNIKWKCSSISITVLLFCVAARSGLEDATDFVSTIFRGADWSLSTHSSFVLNSLSSSHEELSRLSTCVIVFYLLNQRGWSVPSFYCNEKS